MPTRPTDEAASIMSDTMTLVDRPDPPTATLLLPGHSTRASLLSHHTLRRQVLDARVPGSYLFPHVLMQQSSQTAGRSDR